MPWEEGEGSGPFESKSRYVFPMIYLPLDDNSVEKLIEKRKIVTKDRELFLKYQTEFRDKYFKELASECLKELRAIEFWLGEITGKNRKQIQKEIAEQADRIYYALLY